MVRKCKRRGFTIVELMTTIVIIGLLCALLIPGMMYSRERARDAQCRNNLHQIGLAFNNFESTNRYFPTSGMPFARIQNETESVDALMRCPSDPRNDSTAVLDRSYFVNDGTRFRWSVKNGFAVQPMSQISQGRVDCRAADITDGLSMTAAVCERLLCLQSDQGLSDAQLRSGDPKRFLWYISAGVATEDDLARACSSDRQTPFPLEVRPSGQGDLGYDHILPPNVPGCYNSPPNPNHILINDAIPATSQHSAHVNLLMCDGSVRSVHDSIDLQLWRAIGTRNGNETLQW